MEDRATLLSHFSSRTSHIWHQLSCGGQDEAAEPVVYKAASHIWQQQPKFAESVLYWRGGQGEDAEPALSLGSSHIWQQQLGNCKPMAPPRNCCKPH